VVPYPLPEIESGKEANHYDNRVQKNAYPLKDFDIFPEHFQLPKKPRIPPNI